MNDKIKKNKKSDIFADKYMKEHFPSVPAYSNEEIVKLCNQFLKTRDPEIKNKLIEANIRRVIKCAYHNHSKEKNLDLEELISMGLECLGSIIEGYNGLATGLTPYITSSIYNRFNKSRKVVNSFNLSDLEYKRLITIMEAIKEYYSTNSQEDLLDYLIRTTGIEKWKVLSLLNAVGEEANLDNMDVRTGDNVEKLINNEVLKKLLHQLLDKALTEREKTVIVSRYGLDGKRPKTLSETGQILNISKPRVQQIEYKALRKIREATSRLVIVESDEKNRLNNKYGHEYSPEAKDMLQIIRENAGLYGSDYVPKEKAEGYTDYYKDYEGLSEEEYEDRGMGFK